MENMKLKTRVAGHRLIPQKQALAEMDAAEMKNLLL